MLYISCKAWAVFVGLLLSVNLILIFFVYPKWGSKIPYIATTIAASFASIAAIKAVGVGCVTFKNFILIVLAE